MATIRSPFLSKLLSIVFRRGEQSAAALSRTSGNSGRGEWGGGSARDESGGQAATVECGNRIANPLEQASRRDRPCEAGDRGQRAERQNDCPALVEFVVDAGHDPLGDGHVLSSNLSQFIRNRSSNAIPQYKPYPPAHCRVS